MSSPFEFALQARDVILGMTLLESFMDGIYTAIFWFTMYMLLSKREKWQTPKHKITFAIIVPLYILGIIHLAIRWTVTRKAFVVDGDTADDILTSFLGQPTWTVALSSLTFGLMLMIADYVMVWRVWIIWNRNWKVVIIPLLTMITGTVFLAFGIALQINPSTGLFTSNRNKFAKPLLVYFTLSLIGTATSTLMIIYRFISISRNLSRVVGRSQKAIEIVVESAALYCLVLIIYLPFLNRDDFLDGYPQAVLIAVTGIAPTLITARVSLGISSEFTTFKTPANSTTSLTPAGGPIVSVFSQSISDGSVRTNGIDYVDSEKRGRELDV